MAKNDAILLDGIISERMLSDSLDRGEAFEMFAFEQILKSYDLTKPEIDHGWVDGKDDGGIDGFYTFVNGSLVVDPAQFPWPKRDATIEIFIMSCKNRDSFKQDPLNTLFPTIEELLDFEKGPEDFDSEYSKPLIRAREIAVQAFRKTASGLPKLRFKFAYASRGDIRELATNIAARGNQLKRVVADYFSEAEVELDYLGAAELISLHRKNRFVLELPYAEQLSADLGAYILLVRIKAYADFVSDERGNLRRYLFDSNVRDFLGANGVNEEIAQSLSDELAPDFWWLNNGVTILATNVVPLGKTVAGNALQLHDVQIVNGLQTTQTIHNHLRANKQLKDGCVLVKVIVSDDSAVRDKIIRATNNQSSVELASLSATDKIQRDIEAILEQHNWFYERRRNYYKNIGKPVERFIEPLYLAASMVALVRKSPHQAGRLRSRFMRVPESYEAVFSEKVSILIWPKLASIMKFIDVCIADKALKHKSGRRIIAGWRGATALCAIAEALGGFGYTVQQLIEFDDTKLAPERVREIFAFLTVQMDVNNTQSERGRADLKVVEFGQGLGLAEVDVVGRWRMPQATIQNMHGSGSSTIEISPKKVPVIPSVARPKLSREVLNRVLTAMPLQPWKPGTQQGVAIQLGMERKTVATAINELIKEGHLNRQIDGVVIGPTGHIVAIDGERANPKYQIGKEFVRL